jgi:biotin transport system substrate-specific component
MNTPSTLAFALLKTDSTEHSLLRDALLILAGSLFIALLAQIAIPLPFTPIPITGQTFGVLLCGAALGSKRGFLTVAAYISEGAMGLPFFAGGASGYLRLLGPTGGYLVGFLLAAYVCGLVAERKGERTMRNAIPAFALAQLTIYACGMPWLGYLTGFEGIWMKGFIPFLPGLVIKSVAAGLLLPKVWAQIEKQAP